MALIFKHFIEDLKSSFMVYKCNNQIYTAAIPVQCLCLVFVYVRLWKSWLENLFPRALSLLFNGLFVQNILYLFLTRSTAEGFLYFRELAAVIEGGLQRKDWRHFHTVRHLQPGCCVYFIICPLFTFFSFFYYFFPFFVFTLFLPLIFLIHFYLTSYEHSLQQ